MKKIFSKKTLSLFALGLGLAAVSDAALAESKCRAQNNFFRVCITQNGVNQPAIISYTNLTGYPATVTQQYSVFCTERPTDYNFCYRKDRSVIIANYARGQTKTIRTSMPIPKGHWGIVADVRTMTGSLAIGSDLSVSR